MDKVGDDQGYRGPAARAAPVPCLRPHGLVQCLRLLTAVPAARLSLWQSLGASSASRMEVLAAAVAAATTHASKIFARLRRAHFSARLRRAGVMLVGMPHRKRACDKAILQWARTSSEGSKVDKIFLLHESTDLDELYPMVLVAPRVSHSFDFSRGVEIFAAPRDVHPYTCENKKAFCFGQ